MTLAKTPNRSSPDWSPPLVFAEYQLLWLLGRGGMGEVYLAKDTLLERAVAIKFLSSVAGNERRKAQYLTEARASARLQHPNVVTVHRVGEVDGRPYIVSEYVRGRTLEFLPLPLPWPRVLELGLGLAAGLGAAHRCGVLHRDIKPGNAILADSGVIKLLDFGLAQLTEPLEPQGLSSPLASPLAATLDSARPEPLPDGATQRYGRRAAQPPAQSSNAVAEPPSGGPPSDSAAHPWGTPLYMAPEVHCRQPATPRSDVYSMGALLFELCAGVAPHYDVSIDELGDVVPQRDAPLLGHIAPAVEPRLAAIIDRCLRRQPGERFASGEELQQALGRLQPTVGQLVPDGNPYRGLWPFESDQRALFFGRRGEAATLLDRLREQRGLILVSGSGLGKSSLGRAGLLPLVHDGLLEAERRYRVVELHPGRQPLQSLAVAMSSVLGGSEEALQSALERAPSAICQLLPTLGSADGGLLFFVDQLEELLSLSDPAVAAAFAQALAALLDGGPGLRLLGTVRTDAVGRLRLLPGLGTRLDELLHELQPLTAARLRETVLGPAEAKGVDFESPALVDRLVESTLPCDGGLPLLQLALVELWEARQGTTIGAATLAAIGDLAGAMARHADHTLGSMLAERRQVARQILVALVGPGPKRRRRAESQLRAIDPLAPAVLESLVRARLLHLRADGDGVTYELGHDLLLSGWGALQRWIDAELPSLPASPVRPSRAPRRRPWLAGLLVGLLLLVALGVGRLREQRAAQRQRVGHLHDSTHHLGLGRGLRVEQRALRQRALASFDAGKLAAAEELLRRSHPLSRQAEEGYRAAELALERALQAGGERRELEPRLAELLFERAVAAELEPEPGLLAELLARLARYDHDGQWQARWRRAGRLQLRVRPSFAAVRVERYADDRQPLFRLLQRTELGPAAGEPLALEPGAYVLVISAPGYRPVREYMIVERAAEYSQTIELSTIDDVH